MARRSFGSRPGATPGPAADDASLLARIRAGDEQAFEAFFRANAGPLCTFALEIVKTRDLATEVVHDVFLTIWTRRERLEVRDSLKAYVYRATRNRALDVAKRATREREWAVETAMAHAHEDPPPLLPEEGTIEQREFAAALEQAIDEFPERRRMVFLLRWKSGLSYAEIARLMDISIKTVENQMTRALQVLRARLAAHR